MVMMPKEWRKSRGSYYEMLIDQTETDRNSAIKTRDKLREIYNREPGGFDAEEPWENAADLHYPLVTDKVETAVPKIMSAMWRAEPFANVTFANGESEHKTAKHIEHFTTWAFRNDIPDFYRNFENFQRNRMIDPVAFGKIRWSRKWRRTVETHTLNAIDDSNPDGEPLNKEVDELLQEVFNYGDPYNTYVDKKKVKGKANKYEVSFVEAGIPLEATVTIEPAERLGEIVLKVMRDVVEQDCPVIENVDMEDLAFPTRTSSLQTCDWVAHRTWWTMDQLKARSKDTSGRWQISEDDLKFAQGVKKLNDDESSAEQERDKLVGENAKLGTEITSDDGEVDPNRVMVWEVYTKEKVDGSDEPIDVILHILDRSSCVIGIQYHDEVFPHGRRPFIHENYIPVQGRIYGISMAELLYGINLSLNKTLNDVHNAMEITTNPWFMYSIFGMGENSGLLDGVKPGAGIAVGDVNSIRFPDFSQNPAEQFHATFQTMQGIADGLTFSPQLAGSTNYRNAPRTARATLALMDSAEEKLASLVEQSQAQAWKEMVRQVMSLYGNFVGVDKWFYVTGEPEPRRVSPKELRENLMFSFSGSLTSVNRDIQRTLVERMYTILRTDPLYQGDPRAQQRLIRKMVNAYNENGDPEELVPALPGEGGLEHPPWEQAVENYALVAGHYIKVLEIDDHQKHLAEIEKFKKTPMYNQINERARTLIQVHEDDHKERLMAITKQAQQVGNTPGGPAAPTNVTDPGIPAEGQAAFGGELSQQNGGVV